MTCPFCTIVEADRLIETDLVIGFFDRYPVSPGHLLLIPRRHVASWFDATPEERAALMGAIDDAVAIIDTRLDRRPDGYFDTELDQIATATAWSRDTPRSLGVIRGTYLKLPDGVALWHRAKEFTPSRHTDLLQALEVSR